MYLISTMDIKTEEMDIFTALRKCLKMSKDAVKHPKTLLFLSSDTSLREIGNIIHEEFNDITTLGIHSILFHLGNTGNNHIFIAIFEERDEITVIPGLIENVSTCPVMSIASLQNDVIRIAPGKDDTICLEFTTGGEEMLVSTLNAAFGKFNIKLIGGTVNASHEGMITAVVYNGKVYSDACIYLLVKNNKGRIFTLAENIFARFNNKPLMATKVDVNKKALIELNGEPAADVLSKELNISKSQLSKSAMHYPLGKYVGNECFTIGYHDIDTNGTLYNYKQVNLNDLLFITKLQNYREIFDNTIETIKNEIPNIGFILSIDCINRYKLYHFENYFDEYAAKWADLFPVHFGLVSSGEQYYRQHINQAMVCAVFENVEPIIIF
ncbi:MAG: hypothetical protein K6A23_04935 [Butyrivibrio sp.]|nr:hypothetical protein [Butyrivibrio sp.]